MTRCIRTCLTLLAALALVPLRAPLAQTGLSASAAAHAPVTDGGKQAWRIAGRVVSSADAHPLAHAMLQLNDVRTRQPVASAEAGEDGTFAFSGLPRGKFSLNATVHGYSSSAYQQHDQFSTAVVTGAGLPTESLIFQLTPLASISGRVVDEASEPVRGAQVMLFRENRHTGTQRVTRAGNAQTDDLGSYELPDLPPGTYFVAVQATPWYAMHARLPRQGEDFHPSVDPGLDVAYPVTFFPAAASAEEATPVPVKGGDNLTIDLHLTPQRAVTVTIPIAPGTDSRNTRMPLLRQSIFDSVTGVNTTVDQAENAMEITGLAPGRYQVTMPDLQTGQAARFSTMDLTSGSVTLDNSATKPGGTLQISVHLASGDALPKDARVGLLDAARQPVLGGKLNEKGEAEIAGLQPGAYLFFAAGKRRPYHLLRGTLNGKAVNGAAITVPEGRSTADLTVTDVSVTVAGIAKRDAGPNGGAMVVLVPAGADHGEELFRRDQSDLDGSFSLPDAAPGNYILIAIDDGWDLDWSSPAALASYLRQGVPVTVPNTANTPINLAEAVRIQPRLR